MPSITCLPIFIFALIAEVFIDFGYFNSVIEVGEAGCQCFFGAICRGIFFLLLDSIIRLISFPFFRFRFVWECSFNVGLRPPLMLQNGLFCINRQFVAL